ncbi:effector-associated constant component EACC1 [Spirillospora sp. CA-294931]|uniref:effector-associated constant component EACC1 n=1 Tax=Spirillospora sp. CA-294931 TaxID=3240042 RepID=UPI003D8B4A75
MAPTVTLEITEDNADQLRLDLLGRQLLKELRRLGLNAERPRTQAPHGKPITVGTLLVAMTGIPATHSLANAVLAWLAPRKGRVKVACDGSTIEVSTPTPAERERLTEWLLTHTHPRPSNR